MKPRIALLRRRTQTLVHRHWLGLKNVHKTAYIVCAKNVSRDLTMGEYAFINSGCLVGPMVTIGRYTLVARNVSILGTDHEFVEPGVPIIFAGRPEQQSPTVIEDDVWIGSRCTILPGVRIGRGAIVAAGSVVSRDIPPFEIHGGVPNRKIKDRFTNIADKERHIEMLDGPLFRGDFCKSKY